MPKYISDRKRKLDLGINSYTEGSDVLSVTGTTKLSGIVTAITGVAVTYYGDGSNLSGIDIGVGINTAGGNVGYGVTLLDFRGTGVSTITAPVSGISTINITGGGNADQLDGQEGTYYLDYNNFTNTPTIPTNNNELTNGAGYITTSFTNTNQLTNGAGFITASDNITGTAAGLSGTPNIIVGVVTATSFVGDITGDVTGTATTATNLADGANITTGTISNDRLPSTITKNLTGNVTGNLTGDVTGTATTATNAVQLQTARTIGGVSFDGTANINLPGVNATGNQDTSGNAATATQLETARTIAGVSFDGTSDISLNNNAITNGAGYITTSFTNTNQLTNGAGFITASDDITGNAATATQLETARNIGGVSFNGTADINLPGVNATGNQDTSGNAATATTLETARNIGGVSFNGSADINLPGVNAAGNQNTSGTAAGLSGSPNIDVTNITASGNVTIGGTLTYEDVTNVDSVGLITARTGINVVGGGMTVTGIGTFRDSVNLLSGASVTGVVTATSFVGDITGDVTGNADTATTLETARNIGGVSFNGSADINLPGVNATGNQNTSGTAAGLSGSPNIDVTNVTASDIDVTGHVETDTLNVSGITTLAGNTNISGNITSNVTIVSTDAGSSAGPELTLYRNSASPAPGDYLGQLMFKGENSNGGEENYAKITGKISDETLGTEDGLIETAIKGDGSFTIVSRQRSDELQLLNGVGLSVDGESTFTGGIDVDGHTELDTVNVSSAITASSFVGDGSNLTGIANTAFINAEQVNVVGVVTATSASLSSASLASGHITLNNTGAKVIGVVTATSFDGDGSALTNISAGITTGKAIAVTMILG